MMDWKKLSHLNEKAIKEVQNRLLRQQIRQVPFHPFYRKLFSDNNININSIKTTDDLIKIPFTTKEDIAPTDDNPKRPMDFICQPNEELIKKNYPKFSLLKLSLSGKLKETLQYEYKPVHVVFTAGRTSAPTPFLYSQRDLKNLEEAGRRMLDVFQISSDSKAINIFPFAPHLAFWQVAYGTKAANVLTLHTGGGKVMGTERILRSIESMQPDLLLSMPGYAYHLVMTANEQKRKLNSINSVVLGGERVAEGFREKVRGMFNEAGAENPRILATYAFTEGKVAWPECHEGSGYHLYPDMEFIEIVDPKTGERLPDGQQGEIVYTSLDWRGTFVLRYRTRDLGKLLYDKCPYCGRTVQRISSDIQRSSEFKEINLVKIKGNLVNLNSFFSIFSANKDVAEWQAVIKKKRNDPYSVDEFFVYIAPRKGSDWKKLKAELEKTVAAETEITPQIVKKDLKELIKNLGLETELKEKRILDLRPKK